MARKMRHVTCGENETTKHVFERNGSIDYHVTTEKYEKLTERGGPQDKRKSIEETAEAFRHYMTHITNKRNN